MLPFVFSLAFAAALGPALLALLRRVGWTRANHRGMQVAFPGGIVLVAASLLALAAGGTTGQIAPVPVATAVPSVAAEAAVFVIGVALLGLVDDLLGARPGAPRGLRGHVGALRTGRPSTGALKAAGTLGLALLFLSGRGLGAPELLLAAGVLVLTPHLFNLLDLRPGRSVKALLLVGVAVTLASQSVAPLLALGAFLGPVLLLLPLDLRERLMLGDTGASALGAVAGVWIVLALPPLGQAIALALVAAIVAYGELRSISALVERNPLLRQLDSAGRA